MGTMNSTASYSPIERQSFGHDAQLVWAGFCDLHQKHWKDQKAIKVSETLWHLGDKTTNGVHYYYEVILDAQQRIQSARLHSNDPRRPKVE